MNLFNHGDDLDVYSVTGFMVLMIAITIMLEALIHKIDKKLKPHAHYYRMVTQLYQELMILGLISFILLVIVAIFNPPEDYEVSFDFVHIWLFLMACFYIINALTVMLRSRAAKRHWDMCGNMRLEDLLKRFASAPVRQRHYLITWLIGRGPLAEEMEFHIMKDMFLRHEDLPADFDFAKYLRSAMSLRVTSLLHIPNSTWLAFISFMMLNLTRAAITHAVLVEEPNVYGTSSLWLFMAAGWVLFAVSLSLLMLGRRAKDIMMSRAGCPHVDDLTAALEFIRTHPIQKYFASGVVVKGLTHVTVQTIRHKTKQPTAGKETAHTTTAAVHSNPVNPPLTAADEKALHYLDAALEGAPRLVAGQHKRNPHRTLEIKSERNRYVVEDVYLWNSPFMFVKAMEVLTLFQCFYLALGVLVNLSTSANTWSGAATFFYSIGWVGPQAIILFVIAPIVMKNFIFIEAVGHANREVVGQVLLGMQATHALKMYARITLCDACYAWLTSPVASCVDRLQ